MMPPSPGAGPDGAGERARDVPEDAEPEGAEQEPSARVARRRLSLGAPLAGTAAEDRPESWGDRGESDADRLAHYRAQRPPHHGG